MSMGFPYCLFLCTHYVWASWRELEHSPGAEHLGLVLPDLPGRED